MNLELKPVDSTGNPYLALGAFIYAGIDGIRRSLDRRASRCSSTRPSSIQPNGSGCLWSRLAVYRWGPRSTRSRPTPS